MHVANPAERASRPRAPASRLTRAAGPRSSPSSESQRARRSRATSARPPGSNSLSLFFSYPESSCRRVAATGVSTYKLLPQTCLAKSGSRTYVADMCIWRRWPRMAEAKPCMGTVALRQLSFELRGNLPHSWFPAMQSRSVRQIYPCVLADLLSTADSAHLQ